MPRMDPATPLPHALASVTRCDMSTGWRKAGMAPSASVDATNVMDGRSILERESRRSDNGVVSSPEYPITAVKPVLKESKSVAEVAWSSKHNAFYPMSAAYRTGARICALTRRVLSDLAIKIHQKVGKREHSF